MRRSTLQLLRLSLLSLTLLQISVLGCRESAAAETTQSTARSASGILFSTDVPDDQYEELAQDLAELGSVPITDPDPKLLSVMRIPDASPGSLLSWLTERVRFIVDEYFQNQPDIIQAGYEFPNAGIAPVAYGGENDENETGILMSNVGSSYYLIAKQDSLLVSIYVPGIGNIRLTSPRVGLIKIGPGLFDEQVLHVGREPQFRNARRTLQLSVLFHEARHNDGNGAHLTFQHVKCPEGHVFAGLTACDANLNGPYSIEAHFINSINRSCTQCSVMEHEMLRMAALDAASRVQKEIIDPTKDPVAVLRNTQMRASLCDMAKELGLQDTLSEDLARDCAEVPKLQELATRIKKGFPVSVITSTEWDPTPEGDFDPKKDIQ